MPFYEHGIDPVLGKRPVEVADPALLWTSLNHLADGLTDKSVLLRVPPVIDLRRVDLQPAPHRLVPAGSFLSITYPLINLPPVSAPGQRSSCRVLLEEAVHAVSHLMPSCVALGPVLLVCPRRRHFSCGR
jgi:hypothetical protein